MGETDYNALLYDKMKAEQDKYRDWLLSQPPEEILNHTYEYTMREDIVMCIKNTVLTAARMCRQTATCKRHPTTSLCTDTT